MRIKAKESPQVQRAREKLKKEFDKEDKYLTDPNEIQKMRKIIHQWISRHSTERISLAKKNFKIETPHNKHVLHLFSQLQKGNLKTKPPGDLKKRISHSKQ